MILNSVCHREAEKKKSVPYMRNARKEDIRIERLYLAITMKPSYEFYKSFIVRLSRYQGDPITIADMKSLNFYRKKNTMNSRYVGGKLPEDEMPRQDQYNYRLFI